MQEWFKALFDSPRELQLEGISVSAYVWRGDEATDLASENNVPKTMLHGIHIKAIGR